MDETPEQVGQQRLVVAITGASGVVYGVRLLEVLRDLGMETHLIMSKWAKNTIAAEMGRDAESVVQLAYRSYDVDNQAAKPSSGSFVTRGMIIAPCSMKSLAAIANGLSLNLIHRAADVTLKEGRKLVLMVRETPFHLLHLENMTRLARAGAVIMPPVPAFYFKPKSIDDIVGHTVGRALDQFAIESNLVRRWGDRASLKAGRDYGHPSG